MSSRSIEIARQALIDQYNANIGRTGGVTPEQAQALQGSAGTPSDANRYVTEDDASAAYITKDTLHANTLLKADTDHTPIELTVAASTIIGRGAAGGIEDLSPTDARTVLGLATGDSPVFGAVKTDNYQNAAGTESLVWVPADTRWEFSDDVAVSGTVIMSSLTDDYIPYHVNDATGLANGPTKTNVDDAVTKKHTQGTDTTLGALTADIDFGGAYQCHDLQLPAANGEAIRQTAKITETLLESATDLKHSQNTDTGTSNATFSVGDLKFYGKSVQLADHDTVVLTTATATYPAHGFVQISTTAAVDESVEFEMGSDGNVNLIRGTANVVANVDTTAKFCIGTAAAQNPLTIKNHLGATVQAIIQFWCR